MTYVLDLGRTILEHKMLFWFSVFLFAALIFMASVGRGALQAVKDEEDQ